MDKGSTFGRESEYICAKTIVLRGYPVSSSIYVHELTYDKGKAETGATGKGLAANKKLAFTDRICQAKIYQIY